MKSKKYYYGLDLLKFVMSIVIVFYHFQQLTGVRFTRIINFYDGGYSFGFIIVAAFFMISGFLECARTKYPCDILFKDYFVPKVIRIYPMVIISVFYTVVILVIGHCLTGEWIYATPDLWTIFISCLLIFIGGPLMGVENALNWPTWYLCVLLICYFLFWAINKVYARLNISPIYGYVIAVIVGTSALYNGWNLPFMNVVASRGYTAFFIGAILYKLIAKLDIKTCLKCSVSMLIFVVVLTAFDSQLVLSGNIQDYAFEYVILPVVITLMITLENIWKKDCEKGFCGRVVKAAGGLSYEIYIWHYGMLVTMAVIKAIFCIEWGYNFIHMVIFTICVVCWAMIMYFGVEKKLKVYLDRSICTK